MPIRRVKMFVAICPVCDKKLCLSMDDAGYSLHDSREDVLDFLHDTNGKTIDEKIAYSCSSKHGNEFLHRYCAKRPCGFCKSPTTK